MSIRSYDHKDRETSPLPPLSTIVPVYGVMENTVSGFPEVAVDEDCSNSGCTNEAETKGGKCLHCIWANK